MQYNKLAYIFLLASIIFVTGCGKDDDGTPTDSFDKEALLANLADNIIIPRYAALDDAAQALKVSIQTFTSVPNTGTLADAREDLLTLQLAWQGCSTFEFGHAGMLELRTAINTYPIDTSLIHSNTSSGIYDFEAASQIDAKGIPAIDYLLFGTGSSDLDVVTFFMDADNQQYLRDVIAHIARKTVAVKIDWTSYRETFVTNTGTSVGSSIGILVNEMNLDFEQFIRDGKIGIPLGVRTLGTAQPTKTEAHYSGNSKQLAQESIQRLKDFYLGRANGNDGLGFEDYLKSLNAMHGDQLLANKITSQFDDILTAFVPVNDPLSDDLVNNPSTVQNLYDEMQQLVVLLKVDMSSALGVLITYQDNDGD